MGGGFFWTVESNRIGGSLSLPRLIIKTCFCFEIIIIIIMSSRLVVVLLLYNNNNKNYQNNNNNNIVHGDVGSGI